MVGGLEGETLKVFRGDTDKYGNPNKVAHGSIEGIFGWGNRQTTAGFNAGKFARSDGRSLAADLYVERGVDIRARDRIERANGQQYAVVGFGMWDQNFPFDGYDFGYMVVQVEAINSA